MSNAKIELDGSFGEGGGQILRTSLTLSLLTGKPFHLCNIRARRKKPGLQPQHLMCVRAAAAIGQAEVKGASKGSCDLVFEPGEVVAGKYHFPIGTAGATGLVLHTLYLPLALRASEVSELVISGGTHVAHAPCFHYLDTTWRAYLHTIGLKLKLEMKRAGFYPRGGGTIRAVIHPCENLNGMRLKNGTAPTRVRILSVVSDLPDDIAKRQARRAANRLRSAASHLRVDIAEESWRAGPGTILALELDTTPAPTLFFALGERGKKAERVADEAVDQLLAYLNAEPPVVDPHSADQLVLPLALASEASSFAVSEITDHLTTNVTVIERFLERGIICDGKVGSMARIVIPSAK